MPLPGSPTSIPWGFDSFNMSPYIGGVGLYNPSGGMVVTYGPQFGVIYTPNFALNIGLNFGFLYVPPALVALSRTYLMQNITGLPLGSNINPMLTTAQISQNKLQYVGISLDSSKKPPSSNSGRIDFFPWMTVNFVPFSD
jgi:hypothetical protein